MYHDIIRVLSQHNLLRNDMLARLNTQSRKTAKIQGCQIDYLIQTTLGVLYLCEIKFTRTIIGQHVIEDIKEKIKRLSLPKNLSIVPVLLYIGEIQDEVLDSAFFGKIINISRFLDSHSH